MHPQAALFDNERPFPILPACVHYAGTEKLMLKTLELQQKYQGRFDVTLDLEDGAPAGLEPQHAQLAARLLSQHPHRAGIRIHDLTHRHWRDDLRIVAEHQPKLAFLVLPKVQSAADVIQAADYIATLFEAPPPLHVLIETHGALADAFAIAAHPGVQTLDFGIMDFVSEHHGAIPAAAMRSPGQFDHGLLRRAKTQVAAAALAHGKVPVHNVTLALNDPAQTRADAQRAKNEFGFLRMWSIHPTQIEPILEVFAPDFAETQLAAEVILAAQKASWAPISRQGVLYDRASYRYHWQVIQRSHLAGLPLPAELEPYLEQ